MFLRQILNWVKAYIITVGAMGTITDGALRGLKKICIKEECFIEIMAKSNQHYIGKH